MANSGDAEPAAAVSPDFGAPVHAGESPAAGPPNLFGPLGVSPLAADEPDRAAFEPRDEPFLDVPGTPPVTKGDGGMWLLFGVIGFVMSQLAAALFIYVAAAADGKTAEVTQLGKQAVPPEWYVVSELLGIWVGFFGAAWLASAVRGTRRLVADLGIRFRWIDLTGIIIGVGGQFLVGALYHPFQRYLHNYNAPTTKLTGGAHGGGFALIAVLTIIGAPFFEELFFRGVVFKALARLFTPRDARRGLARTLGVGAAVVVDGIVFGLAHGEIEQLAGLALFGMVLAVISYRTGRLGMNMVSHASFNLVAIIEVLRTGTGVIH